MNKLTNPDFLKDYQYRDSRNLSKRASLHKEFGTNPVSWQRWLWEKLDLPDQAAVLDLGSGPGYFWQEHEKTVPAGCKIFLTDISGGMLKESRALLSKNKLYSFLVVDAVNIPFPEDKFDLVIANHMLHHVRDLKQALVEVRRVLNDRGVFCAATNRKSHLKELITLEKEFFGKEAAESKSWISTFNLENGSGLLAQNFGSITRYDYLNQLRVTDAGAITAYLQSKHENRLDPISVSALNDYLNKKIEKNGWFEISAQAGVFIASS
jgi:ubiquinone/menaquinone biosynthesis C-methylase UbiE